MCGAGSRRLPRLSRPLPAAWRAAFPGMPRDATWFMLVFDVLFPLPFLTLSLVGTVQGWNPFFGDLSGPLPHVVWPMLLTVPCLMRRLDPDAAAWSFVAIALLQLLFGPALLTIDIFAAPMLFTAIGFYKPVLASPELNPEVLQQFKIGQAIDLSSVEAFSQQLEGFIDDLVSNTEEYQQGLNQANIAYGQDKLIKGILKSV